MKTSNNIYQNLEIASIIIGAIIIIASIIPAILAECYEANFSFDTADVFLFGFFVGAAVMVGGHMLFDYLDTKQDLINRYHK